MNNVSSYMRKGSAAVLFCSVALVAGCSVTVMPKTVPSVKGIETASLSGVTVIVTNAEKDSSPHDILNEKGQKLGFIGNRQAWSQKLVEALSGEFARRGAQVRATAPLDLRIALPEIIFIQNRDLYQFKVKAAVTASTGWSKNYDAVAESGSGMFESVDTLMDRLAGKVLVEAVKAMLSDAEFLGQLTGNK